MFVVRRLALFVVCLAPLTQQAVAQSRHWEIGVRAGGGPSAAVGTLGGMPDRQLFVGSVYATYPLVRWKRFAVSGFGEALPVVVATRVPRYRGIGPHVAGTVLGAGLLPVGLRLSARIGAGVLTYVDAQGGGVAFTRAMPEPDARAVNFLATAGLGFRLGKGPHRSYLLGYRFTHISNAYTAEYNPGFNAHVIYLGMTLR